MDFFGMGSGEVLLIIIVALIIWGPGKLPEIARTIGKAMSSLRQTSSDLTSQIKKELEAEEAKEKAHSPPPEVTKQPEPVRQLPTDTTERGSGED